MSITRLRPPPLDFLATDYSPPKPTKKVRPNPQQVWPHFGGTLFSAANGAHRRSRQLVFTSPADIAQPPHCTEDTSHLPRVPQPHTAPSLPSAHNKDISACPRPVSSGFLSVFLAPIPASSTPPFPPGGVSIGGEKGIRTLARVYPPASLARKSLHHLGISPGSLVYSLVYKLFYTKLYKSTECLCILPSPPPPSDPRFSPMGGGCLTFGG